MTISNPKTRRLVWILALGLLGGLPAHAARSRFTPLLSGVVKIYATFQAEDYTTPWQTGRPGSGTGTGFVIAKRRILTNAHVVSNARFLEVSRDGQPGRYLARVAFIAHDCDLAALTVDDPAFFDGITPLSLAKAIPSLNDEVTVLGYPTGGDRISVTRGVVSRIDYSGYSHSGVDQHLVLQVDAAINPGNSGGPILFDRRVVGLAFQGLAWALVGAHLLIGPLGLVYGTVSTRVIGESEKAAVATIPADPGIEPARAVTGTQVEKLGETARLTWQPAQDQDDMIKKFIAIRNVEKFENSKPTGDVELRPLALVYAANGRRIARASAADQPTEEIHGGEHAAGTRCR